MASRATVRRQLSEIRASGKWRQLGFLERSVWLHLYAEAADAPEPGRIEFLGPFLPALAHVLDLAEPEVERAVAVLRDARLVELDAEGRAAWLPGARVVTSSRKAEAARMNGRQGGRPRKPMDPRQGFMVHEVPRAERSQNGAGETHDENPRETQVETHPAWERDARVSLEEEEERSSNQILPPPPSPGSAAAETHQRLAAEVSGFLGTHRPEPRVIAGWMDRGATEEDIRAGLQAYDGSGKRQTVHHTAEYVSRYVLGVVARRRSAERHAEKPTDGRARTAAELWDEAENTRWNREWEEHTKGWGPFPKSRQPYRPESSVAVA